MVRLTHFSPIFLFIGLWALSSCEQRPECKNTNPVFEQANPAELSYKKELVERMSEADYTKLRFWYEDLKKEGDRNYLVIHIQGEDICAEAQILVLDWHRLEEIRDSEGKALRGKEIKGLRIGVQEDPFGLELLYKGHERFIR